MSVQLHICRSHKMKVFYSRVTQQKNNYGDGEISFLLINYYGFVLRLRIRFWQKCGYCALQTTEFGGDAFLGLAGLVFKLLGQAGFKAISRSTLLPASQPPYYTTSGSSELYDPRTQHEQSVTANIHTSLANVLPTVKAISYHRSCRS